MPANYMISMGPTRDFAPSPLPLRRYAILATPRSGSTLLARALTATGQLGFPLEYLNRNAISAFKNLGGAPNLDALSYLEVMEQRRTSPSGWFGMKIHFSQLQKRFGRHALHRPRHFIARQDRLILIERADHVAQAVSLYRARATGIWNSPSTDFVQPVQTFAFEPDVLLGCLKDIQTGVAGWRALLARTGAPFHPVSYQALCNDYTATIAGVLSQFGLGEIPVPPPQIAPLPRAAGDDLDARFRTWLAERGLEPALMSHQENGGRGRD
jgi:trehalose 2-sulfotransferase